MRPYGRGPISASPAPTGRSAPGCCLWPCCWATALAAPHALPANDYAGLNAGAWPNPILLLLFVIGATVMRGAGCTFNDIVDRDFDGKVARTRARPIPSGAVSVRNAVAFLMIECVIGLFVLLCLNRTAVLLGVASLGLVAIYPFMKRFTYWPQIFLGLAFNWGAILGWGAVTGGVAAPALALYLAGIAWTLVYDTIYAHQDKEDDILIGVKSTALLFGRSTKALARGLRRADHDRHLDRGRARRRRRGLLCRSRSSPPAI